MCDPDEHMWTERKYGRMCIKCGMQVFYEEEKVGEEQEYICDDCSRLVGEEEVYFTAGCGTLCPDCFLDSPCADD